MKCNECGYIFGDNEIIDEVPAQFDKDEEHPNYDHETNCIIICPKCYEKDIEQDNANYRMFMSGMEYACGIRD